VGAFPGLLEIKPSMGLSEILGHLDVLEASGED
jgi:hypothetical protein